MFNLSGKGLLKGVVALLLVAAAVIAYTIVFGGGEEEEEIAAPQRVSKRVRIESFMQQPLQETPAKEGASALVSETPAEEKKVMEGEKVSQTQPGNQAVLTIPTEKKVMEGEKASQTAGVIKPEEVASPKEELTPKSEEKDKESKAELESKKKTAYKLEKWAINFSSTASREEALELTKRLKKGGYNAYLTEFKSKGGSIWYRVRVGFFASEKEAKGMTQRIAKEFSLKDYWVVKPSRREIASFSKG